MSEEQYVDSTGEEYTSIKPVEGKNIRKGYLLVSIAVITWSFSEIFQKLLQDTVPPMSKSFMRFFIGAIPLLIIGALQKDLKMKGYFKRNWKLLLISGIFAYGIGNFVYFLGITKTQANLGSAIYGAYPIIISVYSIFLVNERQNLKRRTLGYVIGLFGIFMLVTELDFSALGTSENITGNLLVLLGALIWSLFSVLGKKIALKEDGAVSNIDLKYNIITMLLACSTNLVFILFMPEEMETFFQYPARSWLFLILLGVFSTGIGTWLFFVGIKHIEVSKGISLAMFKPIFVAFLAYIILGELPSLILIASLPLVLLAVWLVTKK